MNRFWSTLTLFFLLAAGIGIMTHAAGFSSAAGTLIGGVNTLGKTVEGR